MTALLLLLLQGPAVGTTPRLTVLVLADTVRGTVTYTAGARATGAQLTVRAVSFPAGTWTGLPVAKAGPAAGSVSFQATNTTADSADFTPCVRWTNSGGKSALVCGAAKRWRRAPTVGMLQWDAFTEGHIPVASLDIGAVDSTACTRDSPSAIRCTLTLP